MSLPKTLAGSLKSLNCNLTFTNDKEVCLTFEFSVTYTDFWRNFFIIYVSTSKMNSSMQTVYPQVSLVFVSQTFHSS